jgi:hypothetical protein
VKPDPPDSLINLERNAGALPDQPNLVSEIRSKLQFGAPWRRHSTQKSPAAS